MTDRLDIPIHGPYHHPLGPDPIPGGFAVREIKVFEDVNLVLVGDGAYIFEIPEDLHESMLVKAEAYVTTPSTSGSVQVQLRLLNDGFAAGGDMLSTKISIEPNEYNSKTALDQPVVIFPNQLDWGDHIAIDVDNAGSGAKGLGVIVVVAPLHLASIALKGLKGDPGGFTALGQWNGATTYTAGQAVSSGGASYVAITGSTGVQPGVTPGWETSWMLLAGAQVTSSIEVIIDGSGRVLDAATPETYVHVPFACTIVEATLLANTAGSIVLDIWKDTYGNFPPTDADSITASSPPTLSSAIKTTDTTLAGWTTSIAAGDVLAIHIDSCSLISKITLALRVTRT